MIITATPHYNPYFGKGYYLTTEYMDKTWYKGDTAKEAVDNYLLTVPNGNSDCVTIKEVI